VTPDGQRTFCADLGASTRCAKFEAIAASEARILYVSSITLIGESSAARLAARYMEAFRKAKKRVALSIENPPMVAHHRDFLLSMVKKYADVLFLNEDEAEALLGAGAEWKLLLLKPKIPIYLKKGATGSALFLSCRKYPVEPLKAKVKDTTGAGDAYAAGALYGICRGYSFLSSGKIGTYLATKVVEKFGAGIPLRHIRMVKSAQGLRQNSRAAPANKMVRAGMKSGGKKRGAMKAEKRKAGKR
jgi:sugar/nucleoside kinase (ribokinase family)